MSFGYDTVKVDFDEDKDGKKRRNLKELKLWDTSDVNWGMNTLTMASKEVPYAKLLEAAFNEAKGDKDELLKSIKSLEERPSRQTNGHSLRP